MNVDLCRQLISRHSRPMRPQPTGLEPVLKPLRGIKAVLFDIYGTLVISASGDIGGDDASGRRAAALAEALAAIRPGWEGDAQAALVRFETVLASHQAAARKQGVEYPEVDIAAVWGDVLSELLPPADASPPSDTTRDDAHRIAVEYEVRVNPVWPMPGARECLVTLARRALPLGLISNAQFLTLELFPALLGGARRDLGFCEDLEFFSYRFRQAKPGRFLYGQAREALARRGIAPAECLYIGNDMLKDVQPARAEGFRTALFAGDARSLRLRQGDPRLHPETLPDLTLTDWSTLPGMINP